MKSFAERLQHVVDTKKIKQNFIVQNTRFDSAQVSRWLSGEVKSPIRTTIAELAGVLECDFKWLADNEGKPFPDDSIKDSESYTPPPGSGNISTPRDIPVVGRVPAGIPETNEWEIEYSIQVPDVPEHCFAMKVIGDSMEPSITAGEHVIFTLDYTLESGNVVIVTDEYGDSMVKRYKEKDGVQYLVSDNSKYSPVKPNGGFHIVGKVISSVLQKKH